MRDLMHVAGCSSRSPGDTRRAAALLARELPGGTFVALVGELGSGKTTFVQGAVEGLGGAPSAEVLSPTFVLVRRYPGRRPVTHVDAYRLSGPAEFEALGAEEVSPGEGVTFVEWADKVEEAIPRPYMRLDFTHRSRSARVIEASVVTGAREGKSEALVEAAKAAWGDHQGAPKARGRWAAPRRGR